MRTFAITVLFVLLMPATAMAGDKHDRALDEGEIFVSTVPVKGAYYPKVVVEGVIDAPPEVVFALVSNCKESQNTYTNVMKSFIVERIGKDVVCSETIDLPWPIRNLVSVTRWKFKPGPTVWTETWTLVKGDFDYANGSWKLTAFGDGTRTHALYENHFSPQISVPDWLTKAFLKVGMPGMIKDLRRAAARRAD